MGSNIRALHAIMHCPNKTVEWLKQLVDIVREVDAQSTEVLLGATGGVRDLLSSGEITTEEVKRFQDLLATTTELPFKVHLLVLSGDDEARYEFLSAEYCATQCGYFVPTGDQEEGMEHPNLGLLSSGGMSSQIFVKEVSHCLQTEIKKGNRLGLEHGMDKGMVFFHKHAKEVIERKIPENFGGGNVLYVAIEMFAGVGTKAGMGGSVVGIVPILDAIEILSTFIEETATEDRMLGEEGERTWRTYVHVMSGIVGKLILQRLHPESKVLFVREFELEEGERTWRT
eukprot:CAMPEP_0201963210 /NCGR_PEP_ID=MMETSP0904-20121228/9148_1 /ASSEMBLY_ACC=CAM_ASM_000553 /TAXON_ID=420261 /ORGANISM="Thalassiosira antarctica, Strain CCMP982" /LENGTH=284 /DNA_ID=CAMNT_0048509775 /DNA_START=111 /DNA_END=962 /DNA_ORIENTATION=-